MELTLAIVEASGPLGSFEDSPGNMGYLWPGAFGGLTEE
jgi:hypothetical protein